MMLKISVVPNSKEQRIDKISENEYKIWLKEKAIDGKANLALIKLLSKEFKIDYKNIKIKNPNSRKKNVEINF